MIGRSVLELTSRVLGRNRRPLDREIVTRHRRYPPRFECLETRFTPSIALASGTGAGADSKWTTPDNWFGNAAPSAGFTLDFPADAPHFTAVNDFAAGTSFNSITIEASG